MLLELLPEMLRMLASLGTLGMPLVLKHCRKRAAFTGRPKFFTGGIPARGAEQNI